MPVSGSAPAVSRESKYGHPWQTGLVVGATAAALSLRPLGLQRSPMVQSVLALGSFGLGMAAGVGIDAGLEKISDATGLGDGKVRGAALGVGLLAGTALPMIARGRPFPFANTIDAMGKVLAVGAAAGIGVQAHNALADQIAEGMGHEDRFAASTGLAMTELTALLGFLAWRRGVNARVDPTTPSFKAFAAAAGTVVGTTALIATERTYGGDNASRIRKGLVATAGAAAVIGGGFLAFKMSRGGAAEVAHLTTSVETVAGKPGSLIDVAKLSPSAVGYLNDVVPAAQISKVMGEPAVDPIRVYVGLEHADTPIARAELGLAELDRMGVFGTWGTDEAGKRVLTKRPIGNLFVTVPPGAGRVDPPLMASAEYMARGDVASVALQYSNRASALSLNKVDDGAATYQHFLAGVEERLRDVPKEQRPRVLIYGNSLGAWVSQETARNQGVAGLTAVDRALWVGTPGPSGFARQMLYSDDARFAADRAQVFEYSTIDELDDFARTAEASEKRLFFHSRDSDPVPKVDAQMLWRRPLWLRNNYRDVQGVPRHAVYTPGVSFLQTVADTAISAKISDKPHLAQIGHTYHTDIPVDVRHALFPDRVSDAQAEAIGKLFVDAKPINVVGAAK